MEKVEKRKYKIKFDIGAYQIIKSYRKYKILVVSSTKDNFIVRHETLYRDGKVCEVRGIVLNRFTGQYDAGVIIGMNGASIIKTPVAAPWGGESIDIKSGTAYLVWEDSTE